MVASVISTCLPDSSEFFIMGHSASNHVPPSLPTSSGDQCAPMPSGKSQSMHQSMHQSRVVSAYFKFPFPSLHTVW